MADRETPDDVPSGEKLLGEEVVPSRYAVPLSTLVGGAFVPVSDQTETHPQPHPEPFGYVDWLGDAPPGVDAD